MFKVHIVSKELIRGYGTTQLRCNQPAVFLASLGYHVRVEHLYRSMPEKGEVNWLHRVVLDSYTEKYIAYAKALGNPVVYDTDDLVFCEDAEVYLTAIGQGRYQFKAEGYLKALQACDAVTVSTPYLKERAGQFHPEVYLLRNALSDDYLEQAQKAFEQKNEKSDSTTVTVAYLSGSKTHDKDFQLVEPALLQLLKEYPNCRVLLVGPLSFSDEFATFGSQFEYRGFIPYQEYALLFREIDINLIPLEIDEPVCQGKSELKYIEAGACAVPSIATPTATFSEVIEHNVNGMLAEEGQWYEQIKSLVEEHDKRSNVGNAAQNYVFANYSPEFRRVDLEKIIRNIWHTKAYVRKNSLMMRLFLRLELEWLCWIRGCRLLLRKLQFGIK